MQTQEINKLKTKLDHQRDKFEKYQMSMAQTNSKVTRYRQMKQDCEQTTDQALDGIVNLSNKNNAEMRATEELRRSIEIMHSEQQGLKLRLR